MIFHFISFMYLFLERMRTRKKKLPYHFCSDENYANRAYLKWMQSTQFKSFLYSFCLFFVVVLFQCLVSILDGTEVLTLFCSRLLRVLFALKYSDKKMFYTYYHSHRGNGEKNGIGSRIESRMRLNLLLCAALILYFCCVFTQRTHIVMNELKSEWNWLVCWLFFLSFCLHRWMDVYRGLHMKERNEKLFSFFCCCVLLCSCLFVVCVCVCVTNALLNLQYFSIEM